MLTRQAEIKQEQGIEIAVRGAKILKSQFGATKVVLFGSMLNASQIYDDSDIDLAVWGLTTGNFLSAGCALDDVAQRLGYDFPPVDLVDVTQAKPHIKDAITREGIEL